MSWRKLRFSDFLKRSKIPLDIQDDSIYKRVTIKIKHNGISLRDVEVGKNIGTKKQFLLKAGQFLLSKIDARYGAFGIAPEEVDGAIITGNFWAYDVDLSIVNIEWFNQFTNSQDFYYLCEQASSGITHRKYLDEKAFLNNEIYLPSTDEQFRIIEEFKVNKDFIAHVNSELNHQLKLVKQLRQAFLREAIQGALVTQSTEDEPASALLSKIQAEKERLEKEKKLKMQKPLPAISEEEVPFEIPDNWVWVFPDQISSLKNNAICIGPFGSDLLKSDYSTAGVPLIFVREITNRIFGDEKTKFITAEKANKLKSHKVTSGDLLITKMGNPPGDTALYPARPNGIITADCIKFSVYGDGTTARFLFYLYSAPQIRGSLMGITKGMGRLKLSLKRFKSQIIPLPPLSEQQRIVAKLDDLMAYCDELDSSIKESQQQNELLLQQVLREALEPKEEVLV